MIRGDKAPDVQAYINQKLNTTGARQEAQRLVAGDPIWARGDVGLERGKTAIRAIENAPGTLDLKTPTRDGDFALGFIKSRLKPSALA